MTIFFINLNYKKMRPTRNQHKCPGCGYHKMVFNTFKEALRFMRFNSQEVKEENGKCPVRAYYCHDCKAYHLTSKLHTRSRKDLVRRFGEIEGSYLHQTLTELTSKRTNIPFALRKLLKRLRHDLKFPVIRVDKCLGQISDLERYFGAIFMVECEDYREMQELHVKFQELKNLFEAKKSEQAYLTAFLNATPAQLNDSPVKCGA